MFNFKLISTTNLILVIIKEKNAIDSLYSYQPYNRKVYT